MRGQRATWRAGCLWAAIVLLGQWAYAVQVPAAALEPAAAQVSAAVAAAQVPAPAQAPAPGGHSDTGNRPIVVCAAASLTDALQELGAEYGKSTGNVVKFSFAASSALARQIESGAPADVFFSADIDWMEYLQKRNLIQTASRRDLLGNRLVLIAPAASAITLKIAPHFGLAEALGKSRLATGDPDSVPVGRYARAALTTLGVWDSVADRIVRAENVRAALAFVDRGEVPLGIVYKTDALVDPGVRIVDTFPADTHPPIIYPIALTTGARSGAAQFADYLGTPAAGAVFAKYGFVPLH
ncbi:MAG TPA: molybdate ABC transporter substrate-binding protein [Steroidobacteraceae bacterium]|nr:molybdate ABC transporter substrate-binding protein [Steroidobacteraceae bacterium]